MSDNTTKFVDEEALKIFLECFKDAMANNKPNSLDNKETEEETS